MVLQDTREAVSIMHDGQVIAAAREEDSHQSLERMARWSAQAATAERNNEESRVAAREQDSDLCLEWMGDKS